MGVTVLRDRTIVVLTVMLCAGVAVALWHLSRLTSTLIESAALQGTSLYSETFEELRTVYTSEVVERVRHKGTEVTHDYAKKEGAIPLPATLSMELGKRIGERGTGMQVRLYSDYPFPWRKDGGPRDAFEREALLRLRENPTAPFYRFENLQGRASLRYVTAGRMRASCVSCHNTHPDSPKTDWKEGEVRGVLEIIRPLDKVMAQTRAGLQGTFALLATMSVLGLSGLALVMVRLRRSAAELEQRVQGHAVVVAGNGRKALAAMESQVFDLVLMDVQMPELDGFQVTAAIREREKATGGHTPIVAMTAQAMKGDRELCLAAGMDGYVSKPIHAKELFAVMGGFVGTAPSAASGAPTAQPPAEVFNRAGALERVDGDAQILGEVAALFLEDCPKMLSAIREAVARRDGEALQRAAHTLKGSVSNFCAPAADEAARMLETIGREGDLSRAEEALAALEKEIERLRPPLVALGTQS